MKTNALVSSGIVPPCPPFPCGKNHGDAENTETIRLGMPELALCGLSEGWLLRECGSRHWSAIAKHFQVPPERLKDSHGNRLYPSFLATRLTGSPLSAFREGDGIHMGTQLTRLSRNRFFSSHRLSTCRQQVALTVEMISALLKRERTQDNTSLREAEVWIRETAETRGADPIHPELASADKAIRNRKRDTHQAPVAAAQSFRYRPSPHCDFNGAGLLYFATYHSIVDRAEWECLNLPEALEWSTSRRDTFFFANINPGDEVDTVLVCLRTDVDTLGHRARLYRVSDGRLMAEVFTTKRCLR